MSRHEPEALRQCFVRRLHARFHADGVGDVLLQYAIQLHQHVYRAPRRAVDGGKVFVEGGAMLRQDAEGSELARLFFLVLEGPAFRIGFDEEVERVVHRHFGDQVDLDPELARRVREYQPRLVVGLGILLPVEEMRRGQHAHRIRKNPGAAVGRRSQAHDLRTERHRPVVAVMRDVIQRYMD